MEPANSDHESDVTAADIALGLPLAFGKSNGFDSSTKRAQTVSNGTGSIRTDADTSQFEIYRSQPRESGDDGSPSEVDEPVHGDDLPVGRQFILRSHTRSITALVGDPSGARLASGALDFQLKLWDFGGMDSHGRPFRSLEPEESHQISDLAWSTKGDLLLVAPGGTRAKIYDRDGAELGECGKGDPYLRDLKLTSGHTGEVTAVAWHPTEPQSFFTASQDGTIRLWSMENKSKCKTTIVVKSKDRGGRTKVTAMTISPDAKWLAACTTDGSLHVWQVGSPYIKPNYSCEGKAHQRDTETSGLVFAADSQHLYSRGADDTVKSWYIKSLRSGPSAVRDGLRYPGSRANVVLSPDERFVLTGVALDGQEGGIAVLDKEGLSIIRMLETGSSNVIKVLWPAKINQIIAGCSDGALLVLYSPQSSKNGALLAVDKVSKRVNSQDDEQGSALPADAQIILPNALPAFADANPTSEKRRMEKIRKDPVRSHRPDMPITTGPGKGGRIGASATQHLVRTLVKDKMSDRNEDPREALLKYQHKDGEEATWTSVYKDTQPVPIFRKDPKEIREEEEAKRKKARLW